MSRQGGHRATGSPGRDGRCWACCMRPSHWQLGPIGKPAKARMPRPHHRWPRHERQGTALGRLGSPLGAAGETSSPPGEATVLLLGGVLVSVHRAVWPVQSRIRCIIHDRCERTSRGGEGGWTDRGPESFSHSPPRDVKRPSIFFIRGGPPPEEGECQYHSSFSSSSLVTSGVD